MQRRNFVMGTAAVAVRNTPVQDGRHDVRSNQPTDETDPAVTQLEQVPGRHLSAESVVDRQRRHGFHVLAAEALVGAS